MPSFADNIANLTYNSVGSFSNQIQGQANRIAQLQGAGAAALGASNPQQLVQQAFSPGSGKDLIRAGIEALKQNPELMKLLPPQLQQKLQQAIPELRGNCCGCPG